VEGERAVGDRQQRQGVSRHEELGMARRFSLKSTAMPTIAPKICSGTTPSL
jgi:hypothetical protein